MDRIVKILMTLCCVSVSFSALGISASGLTISFDEITPTSVTVKIGNPPQINTSKESIKEIGCIVDDVEYPGKISRNILIYQVELQNLSPGKTYYPIPYMKYADASGEMFTIYGINGSGKDAYGEFSTPFPECEIIEEGPNLKITFPEYPDIITTEKFIVNKSIKITSGFSVSYDKDGVLDVDQEGYILLQDLKPNRTYWFTIMASGSNQAIRIKDTDLYEYTEVPLAFDVESKAYYRGFDFVFSSKSDVNEITECGIKFYDNLYKGENCKASIRERTMGYTFGSGKIVPYVYLNGNMRHRYDAIDREYKTLDPKISLGTITQSKLKFEPKLATDISNSDEVINSASITVKKLNGNVYFIVDGQYPNKPDISGLTPTTLYEYELTFTSKYNTYQKVSGNFKTLDIPHRIQKVSITPTTASVKVDYGSSDWQYDKVELWANNEVDPNVIIPDGATRIYKVKGLIPNAQNSIYLRFTDSKKNIYVNYELKVKTEDIKLENLDPKVVAEGIAVVAAKTNIDDAETNVGFQWRKLDAPESLKSRESYGKIYEGLMEGLINNMVPQSYYKVRPFYHTNSTLSSEPTYFYGEWITLDPSDFSYFEPTIRTYEADLVTHNSAQLHGYVMRGTEEISEQGFEYWLTNGNSRNEQQVVVIPVSIMNTDIALADNNMTITLSNLLSQSEYHFRAYAKYNDKTFYGEEKIFNTTGSSHVNSITTDSQYKEPLYYIDINGCRHLDPIQGFNIVVYSDGTTAKIINK